MKLLSNITINTWILLGNMILAILLQLILCRIWYVAGAEMMCQQTCLASEYAQSEVDFSTSFCECYGDRRNGTN